MKESKNEKVSPRAMESAMIIRLFKDAMESERPIMGSARWEQEDGSSLELGRVEPHPGAGSASQAAARLRSRLGALIGGEGGLGDTAPIARLRAEDGSALDFSMESFDQCALGDDGALYIRVGSVEADGQPGARLELMHEAHLRLFGQNGEPLGRERALLPLRELQEIKRAERAAQERREEELSHAVSDRSDELEGLAGRAGSLLERELQESSAPAGWGTGARSEQMLTAMGRDEAPAASPHEDWWTPSASDEPASAYSASGRALDDAESLSPEDARNMLLSAFASSHPETAEVSETAAALESERQQAAPERSPRPRRSPIPSPEPELEEGSAQGDSVAERPEAALSEPSPMAQLAESLRKVESQAAALKARQTMDEGLALVRQSIGESLREDLPPAARSASHAQAEPVDIDVEVEVKGEHGIEEEASPAYLGEASGLLESLEAGLGVADEPGPEPEPERFEGSRARGIEDGAEEAAPAYLGEASVPLESLDASLGVADEPGPEPTPSQQPQRALEPGAPPRFLPVSFEAPSDGFDEVAFAVECSDVGAILKELSEYPRFEARLTHKAGSRMMLALALPRGELAALNPLVERHAKGGVMIRRAKGK